MKFSKCILAPALAALINSASAVADTNPLSKVLELLGTLEAKVTKEGEAEAAAYNEYIEWCDDTAKNGKFSIDTASKQVAKLDAQIAQLTSNSAVATDKIADLVAAIAQAESELKNATLIREKEEADFKASDAELVDVIETLERATGILEKEMAKNPAMLAQIASKGGFSNMISALSDVLDAASFSSADQKKLTAFVQSQSQSQSQTDEEEDDMELQAPEPAVYKSKSGSIVDVLEDLKEKAESELSELRKAETTSKHNFEMMKQSLEDQMAADNKDLEEEKAAKAAAEEAKATATGDLEVAKKDLADSTSALETAQSTCMQVAADHEQTLASRAEELKALAEAKKVLEETSSGAVAQSYSFLQLKTRSDLRRSEVVAMVKRLAKHDKSTALAQLASRMEAVLKFGSSAGEDPFAKVKSLITDMIAKLEGEMGAEAQEKAYCDEQMTKTEAKKSELEATVEKLTSKSDKAAAKSASLKAEVAELQAELAALAKEQVEMDKIRADTKAAYEAAKADLEIGLTGVRKALTVLREYYSSAEEETALVQTAQPAMPEKHSKAGGAGSSIIGMLEVIESDFATNLAKEENEEEDAQADYEKTTQANKITKTTKDQDVKYKTQEAKTLDTTVAELGGELETTTSELAAVNEYYGKIKERCIAKPETYEERKARRAAEISGLKEALSVLEDETATFIQRKRRNFRGPMVATN
mmetsp:Transcript_82130/g.171944  ORF Transcript_82130/g.171944 Transcript_82130/m.171944 type:complete len:705 (-) Transcript_82130:97-2211(-)